MSISSFWSFSSFWSSKVLVSACKLFYYSSKFFELPASESWTVRFSNCLRSISKDSLSLFYYSWYFLLVFRKMQRHRGPWNTMMLTRCLIYSHMKKRRLRMTRTDRVMNKNCCWLSTLVSRLTSFIYSNIWVFNSINWFSKIVEFNCQLLSKLFVYLNIVVP